MNVISDLVAQFACNVALFASQQRSQFLLVVLVALLFAALCWWLCSRWTRLFNLRYRVTMTHHVLCGVAAAFTFLFVLLFASMTFMQQAALERIADWQEKLVADSQWSQTTMTKEYEAVKALNIEDFTNYPSVENGVPIAKPESRQTVAKVMADEAAENFRVTHSFLSHIIHAKAEIPTDKVVADIDQFFPAHPETNSYPNSQGIALTANELRSDLNAQTPRIVTVCRTVFVILFLALQAIPFGLIGYAAYRDLKIST